MENNKLSKDYYIISNKILALAISFITGEDFYTYDDRFDKDKKVYSFKNTENFKIALTEINNLKKKLRG